MNWGKRSIGGVAYDLTHLDPFTLQIPGHAGAPNLSARVRFGSHVFTVAWTPNYIEEYRVADGGKSRCFCTERYGHSLHLRSIIEQSCPGRVLFDPSRKLVMIGNPPRILQPYALFFEMKRVSKQPYDLDILVVSAHAQPLPKAKLGMNFPHLSKIVADGNPIPWPKKIAPRGELLSRA